MKMNELPNNSKGQSIQLDAKGRNVVLEYFADGEAYFWTDDGVCLEFDKRNAALIVAALRLQDKFPRNSRAPAPALNPVAQSLRTLAAETLSAAVEPMPPKAREPNRAVAKEERGWGATVYVDGRPVRYHYDKRDNARAASPEHKIGEAGRID